MEDRPLLTLLVSFYNAEKYITSCINEYIEKQWRRDCAELPAFIIKRIPMRFTFDNNYLNDAYQEVPVYGYNRIIEGLLNGIETKTNADLCRINGRYSE